MRTSDFPADIFTEPKDVDPDTLANLGPLRSLAGVWEGRKGVDVAPTADGPDKQKFIDRIDLQPIDPQTNGPQLFYGLRYHQHVVKPGEVATYHDQIGYWLWEPATGTIIQTLAIPRGQVAMAMGKARPKARTFELVAQRGDPFFAIASNPFLDYAFKTAEYRIKVSVRGETWTYDETTTLYIKGQKAPFLHTDRSVLTKIAEPTPNPMMRG